MTLVKRSTPKREELILRANQASFSVNSSPLIIPILMLSNFECLFKTTFDRHSYSDILKMMKPSRLGRGSGGELNRSEGLRRLLSCSVLL